MTVPSQGAMTVTDVDGTLARDVTVGAVIGYALAFVTPVPVIWVFACLVLAAAVTAIAVPSQPASDGADSGASRLADAYDQHDLGPPEEP